MTKKLLNKLLYSYFVLGTVSALFSQENINIQDPELIVLGIAQDAGAPQINCKKECCMQKESTNFVVSLGIADDKKRFLIEATPDIGEQIQLFDQEYPFEQSFIDGIFITHAHIGHYSGLMYLGKEAMSATAIPTYMMPRMYQFMHENGPWNQLIENKNIHAIQLVEEQRIELSKNLSIVPFLVPHRDEYSETVGYKIQGPNTTVLFIPDIDKWTKWGKSIEKEVKKVDIALLDATFYDGNDLNGRDMSSIPHPFVEESFKIFDELTTEEKSKIHFIHFNHTNPLLKKTSNACKKTLNKGYKIAHRGMRFKL